MFFLQNSGGEGVFGVVVFHGDDGLEDDGASVEIFVDEMDGAAGEFDTVFEGLALGFEAGERGKERRMDVEDRVGEGGYKIGGEEAHVAGEADQINFVFLENGYDLPIVSFALETFRRNRAVGDVAGFGAVEARGAFAVADDDGDFGVRDAAGGDAVGQGFEVGAATA